MQGFFLAAGIALLAMMSLVFVRVLRGPTVLDRVVGLNVVGTKTVVLLVIIGALTATVPVGHGNNLGMFVDLALTYALLNFVGGLAASKLLARQAGGKSTERCTEDQRTQAVHGPRHANEAEA